MLDILILGATGYTGRLITRYLATHPQRATFTLCLAARSKQKLNALIDELDDAALHVRTFIVDVTSSDDVEAVVQEAHVVINAVALYSHFGNPVLPACVHHKRHYLDIVGELSQLRGIIQNFDHLAAESNTVIVPCAGMVAVPSDLMSYVANKTLKSFAGPLTGIDMSTSAWEINGFTYSGGSIASGLAVVENPSKEAKDAVWTDFILSPVRGVPSPRPRAFYSLPILDHPPMRGTFFAQSMVNRRIIQRSWGLFELAARNPTDVFPPELSATVDGSEYSYGTAFKYDEFLVQPNWFRAFCYLVKFVCIIMVMAFPFALRIACKFLPQPGQGPTDEQLEARSLNITNITTSTPDSQGRTVSVRTTFKGKGDGAYLMTAIFVSEAALALVLDKDSLPPFGKRGGVLTPMTAFGDVLVRRLNACDRISIESEVLPTYEHKKIR